MRERYLDVRASFVSPAGEEDDERPVVGVHVNAGRLSARGVERGRAAAVGTLNAAAGNPLHPLPTVVTFLHTINTTSSQDLRITWLIKARLISLSANIFLKRCCNM